MEKVLQQILDELKSHGQELNSLRQGQEALIKRVGDLELGQKELRADQFTLIQGQSELRQGQQEQGLRLTKLAMHVEGELTDKIRALFDSREVMNDTFTRINHRLDRHADRLNLHWQEINVLKTKRRP